MGNGKKSLYPKMQTYSLHDFETVIRHMHEYAGTFGEGTIRGVIDALVLVMERWMPMGHTIKIDGLGVFSLSLGFSDEKAGTSGEELKHKENYRHVCAKGINFKVDQELIKDINRESTFERAQPGVQRFERPDSTLEQRMQRAHQLISDHGYITLSDYAIANHVSRSMASRDLKRITADPASGIIAKGSHSHKVWVKKSI
jgi:predicted histone-like DNA-binding protein